MTATPLARQAKLARIEARKTQRARIIAEIRRLAAENGGVPPGWRHFISATGIPRSALTGGTWARWSEALREAGLAPNPGQPRLDDQHMLARIAEVARALRRLPAASDLAAWRSAGRPLAAHSTYLRHFGSMPDIFRALKRWAAADPGRAEIAAMLAGIADAPIPAPRVLGGVYLLRHRRAYKIGCSRTVHERVHELRQTLPEPAKLVHVIGTDDPHGVETYWHRRFAGKRLRGEWFRLSAEDVAAFRQRQFQ